MNAQKPVKPERGFPENLMGRTRGILHSVIRLLIRQPLAGGSSPFSNGLLSLVLLSLALLDQLTSFRQQLAKNVTIASLSTSLSICVVIASGCASSPSLRGLSGLRRACPNGTFFNSKSLRCAPWGQATPFIKAGEKALTEGEIDVAISEFTQAEAAKPHPYPTHVRLYEQLGIAHSYAGDETKAKAAFTHLLRLDPSHLISYNTSPQATLKFEDARNAIHDKPTPEISVNWPDDAEVSREVPIEIEVIADPGHMLERATLYLRDRTEQDAPTHAVDIVLAPRGKRATIKLPALGGQHPRNLAVYLVARDKTASEVLLWASESQPRALRLGYTKPEPLYKKWWVLTIAGAVLIGGGGSAAYFIFRDPPSLVNQGGVGSL